MLPVTPLQARRNLRRYRWINFLAGLAFLSPVVQLFYTHMGLSLYQIILLSNIGTLCVWLLELPTSVLADTTGRKRSLVFSVSAHFMAVLVLLLSPQWWGFVASAVLGALYYSFWSGTGQAFLEENLRVLGEEQTFGRAIGHLMFLENLASFLTPLLASWLLKNFPDTGYQVLLWFDAVVGLALVVLTLQLRELPGRQHFTTLRSAWQANVQTARTALRHIGRDAKLRLLLFYRSLGNHVAYFPIILLPTLEAQGMPVWYAGVLMAGASIATMLANKYVYRFGERYGYSRAWVYATTLQGLLCVLAGCWLGHWWVVAGLFLLFSGCDGVWQPAWNHTLVEHTQGASIATTRSIIFSVFALYTTLGKQLLGLLPVGVALLSIGGVLLVVNALLGRKMLHLGHSPAS